MKALRVWLLLLLAVLLPVRGAVAATMLCSVGGMRMQTNVNVGAQPAAHAAMAQGHHQHRAGHHGHHAGATADIAQAADPAGQDRAAADKCNLCSASCSLTPLVSALPTLAEPLAANVEFSALSAPPPQFFSDGQDRPPRTC